MGVGKEEWDRIFHTDSGAPLWERGGEKTRHAKSHTPRQTLGRNTRYGVKRIVTKIWCDQWRRKMTQVHRNGVQDTQIYGDVVTRWEMQFDSSDILYRYCNVFNRAYFVSVCVAVLRSHKSPNVTSSSQNTRESVFKTILNLLYCLRWSWTCVLLELGGPSL